MSREIIDISRIFGGPLTDHNPLWRVEYIIDNSGRTYFRHVHAKDELEAYTIVMGFRKQPTEKAPITC